MPIRLDICRYNRWHQKGVRCECGRKAIFWSERKCH